MRSIFRYPGGKTRRAAWRWILGHRPEGTREYREPFVGGGGVFFALEPRQVQARWVNDSNPGLVEVYKALRDRPDEFIGRCRAVPPLAGGEDGARLEGVFNHVRLNEEEDQAFRYFFVNRTVFGGRVNYAWPSRLYFSKPLGWDVVKGDHLERAARHVAGAKVTCGDFEPLFAEPGEGVWVYADPPYWCNLRFSGNTKLYQHSFTEADHRRLAAAVRSCPHKVCLSYDDCPEVRALYAGMHVVAGGWTYGGSTKATKDRGRELLVLNYDPPQPEVILTDPERAELASYEAVIERGRRSFVEIGRAFAAIRDRRLYRPGTFEQYVPRRWGRSKRWAYHLIDAAAAVAVLETCTIGHVPRTESQARQLTRLRDPDGALDVEAIQKVWPDVLRQADGKPVTAALVEKCVKPLLPPRERPAEPPLVGYVRRAAYAELCQAMEAIRRGRPGDWLRLMAAYAEVPCER